jgi:hypothetical protein
MKRGASLKSRSLLAISIVLPIVFAAPVHAATFSIQQILGSAQHAPALWGQTFTVPVGKSGQISSVNSLTYTGYFNTVPSVIWAKVWDSPSKTILIATSTNTYTGPINPSGFTSDMTFSLNFPTFLVTGGSSYFLEVGRSSGDGYFFIAEDGTDPYADGSIYRDGVIDTGWDLKFAFDINLVPPAANPPVFTSGTQFNKGVTSQITVTTSIAGAVMFKFNGKYIPRCQRVVAIGSPLTATCNWKPPVTGTARITAQLLPADSATYGPSSAAALNAVVSSRDNKR